MSFHTAAAPSLAAVQRASLVADINYLQPQRERPYNYTFEPPAGAARSNAVYAPHPMTIADARPLADGLSLDREGFQLVRDASAAGDFDDEEELRRVYYPEAERLVAAATGASRVVIFDH